MVRPVKLAILSDVHIGYAQFRLAQRFQDFANAFEEAVDSAIENNVDIVLILGDLFNEAPKPHAVARNQATRIIKKLKDANIRTYVIAGNHEVVGVSPYGKESDIDTLELAEMVTALRDGKSVYLPEFDLELVGTGYLDEKDPETRKKLMALRPATNAGKKVLLLHQTLADLFPEIPPEEGMIDTNDVSSLGFDLVALGHVHKPFMKKLNGTTIIIAGGTERWHISETSDKYLWIVDWNDGMNIRQIKLKKVRPLIHETINCDGLTREEIINRVTETIRSKVKGGEMVRIILEGHPKEDGLIDTFALEKVAMDAGALIATVVNKIVKERPEITEEMRKKAADISLFVKDYLSKKGLEKDVLDRQLLLFRRLLDDIVEKGAKPEDISAQLLGETVGEGD